MYNNPAFQMFLMAAVDRFWPTAPQDQRGWPTGTDRMLIVSIGTGTSPDVRRGLDPDDMSLLFNATTIPSALMFAALNEQDFSAASSTTAFLAIRSGHSSSGNYLRFSGRPHLAASRLVRPPVRRNS